MVLNIFSLLLLKSIYIMYLFKLCMSYEIQHDIPYFIPSNYDKSSGDFL